MFDQLFKCPRVLVRLRTSPLLKERLAYLRHLASQGYARSSLRDTARDQLTILNLLGFDRRPCKTVTLDEIKRKASYRQYLFAVRWLRFAGRLPQRPVPLYPCAKKIRAFVDHMDRNKGLSPDTIRVRCVYVAQFLKRLRLKHDSLQGITPHRFDIAFQRMLNSEGYARSTVKACADSLRAFFRFAETRNWCRKGLAASIRRPRVFSQASLPLGPSWDDVQRLLATTEGNQRHKIRARAILMLFAVYGLRMGETRGLKLEDFDWEHETFTVVSSKAKRARTYPLTRSVGDAILRYLREVRPRSPHRELFLSLKPPFRPVTTLYGLVDERLRSLGVTLPHYGPHSLRHACAGHLLAAGLSLKEIGDQLGHKTPETTRVYAKVDLMGLRDVADFDMGGVL